VKGLLTFSQASVAYFTQTLINDLLGTKYDSPSKWKELPGGRTGLQPKSGRRIADDHGSTIHFQKSIDPLIIKNATINKLEKIILSGSEVP